MPVHALATWLKANLSYAVALGVLVASTVLALFMRRLVRERLRAWAATTRSKVDDALTTSLHRVVPWWIVMGGVEVATRIAAVPDAIGAVVHQLSVSVLIVSVTLWLGDVASRLLVTLSGSGDAPALAAGTGVARYLVRVLIYLLGTTVLLGTLGVSIAPLVTTLGVGGIAVALGLQNTLSNLFAGVHITLARNLRVGDFVKLETGQEGHIEDIGWRATRLRLLQNSVVVIPNSRLADSVITNYDLPDPQVAVLVQVGVHYGSDLTAVEGVTREVAREVMKELAGGVSDFEPLVRYHTFAASSIDFTVILRARAFTDSFLVKHEFIKRLMARFAREGIVIPYPIRALNLTQEAATKESAVEQITLTSKRFGIG